MGTIAPTPQGTFRVRWYDQHNRQHGKTLKTQSQAKTFLKNVEGEVARGTFVDPKRARIPLSTWIEMCREVDFALEASTVETEGRAAKHIDEVMGDILLANLDSTHVEQYIAGRLADGASPGYVAMEFRYLRKWMNRAVSKGKLTKSPCLGVKEPKGEKVEMFFFTLDQLVTLSTLVDVRYRAWVLTMGVVGLRFSEGVGLRRKNLKLDEKKLDVIEQLVWCGGKFVRKTQLKTAASRRTVTVSSPLDQILREHIDAYAQPGVDGLVFTNRNLDPILHGSFRGNYKRAIKAMGLPSTVRIHDLRHTAVALSVAAGAHPTAIQRRMGHSSISVTLGTYGHLFPELDVDLSDKLGSSLSESLRSANGGSDDPTDAA